MQINWSDPFKVRLGKNFYWRREWLIPPNLRSEFFDFWKRSSEKLKKDGIGVQKKDKDWFIIETKLSRKQFSGYVESATPKSKITIPPYTLKDPSGLRPWQVDPSSVLTSAIDTLGYAIDGSDLGVGKSYQACAVARELNIPFVVICPKAVVNSWNKVATKHFKLNDLFLGAINYEQLRIGKSNSTIASYRYDKKVRREIFKWKIPQNALIVWDECQRLKNWKTQNSKCCIQALKQGYKQLFCSATVATNPIELRTIGTCTGLFKNGTEYREWLVDHGVEYGRFGPVFNNDIEVLKKIRNYLFIDRGVRLRRDSIPGFPETEIIGDCYDISEQEKSKINEVYEEMSLELKRLDKRIKKDKDNELIIKLRARQKIELIKVPLFLEIIEEGIENGMSVAVFLNFTDSLNALAERLNTKCIYDGKTSDANKLQNVEDFSSNKSRVILVNIQSGGAGLTGLQDLTGEYPRLAVISPCWSAQNLRQSTGRVCRDGAKTKSIQKIVFVAGTVEEEVAQRVQLNLNNLDIINDGDLDYAQTKIINN